MKSQKNTRQKQSTSLSSNTSSPSSPPSLAPPPSSPQNVNYSPLCAQQTQLVPQQHMQHMTPPQTPLQAPPQTPLWAQEQSSKLDIIFRQMQDLQEAVNKVNTLQKKVFNYFSCLFNFFFQTSFLVREIFLVCPSYRETGGIVQYYIFFSSLMK